MKTLGAGRALLARREFLPPDMAGCFLWLPADRIQGTAHGGAVAAWRDYSGAGRDATQAAGGLQPLFQSGGGPNGRPFLLFDGTDDYLATGNVTLAQPRTLFAVARRTGNTTQFNRMVWASGGAGELTYNNGVNSVMSYAGTVLGATAGDSAWHVLTTVQNGAASVLRVDGAATSGAVGAGSIAAQPLHIGGAVGPPAYTLAGGIAEVIIYSFGMSVGEQQRVERYLAAKYGLAVS